MLEITGFFNIAFGHGFALDISEVFYESAMENLFVLLFCCVFSFWL
jgi:hypothetical protein